MDALAYDLDVHLTPLSHRLEVTATVRLRWDPGMKEATFWLDSRLKVDVAQVNGQPASTTMGQGWVSVPLLAESILVDETVVTLHYAGEIATPGVWWWPDHIEEGSVALGQTTWYPRLNDFGQDFHTATLMVWVPQTLTVIATGSPAGREETATEIGYRWHSDVPVSLLALVAGMYESRSAESRGIVLTAYARPGHAQELPGILEQAQKILEVYQDAFTPYPHRHFKVAEVVTDARGAWGFPTLVMLQAGGDGLASAVLPHEIAHQWWPGQVMPRGTGAIWLVEGLATYCDLFYSTRPGYAQEGVERVIKFERAYLSHVKGSEEVSIAGYHSCTDSEEPSIYITYYKGALVFRMLEYLLGRETFARCLRTYAERYRFQSTDWRNFPSLCEEVSGQDLDWFFEQWLWTTKRLDYAVEKVEVREGTATVHIRRIGAAIMPLEVQVRFADGSAETQRWDGQAEQGQVTFQTRGRTADRVELDPDHWLLDVDRGNNAASVS